MRSSKCFGESELGPLPGRSRISLRCVAPQFSNDSRLHPEPAPSGLEAKYAVIVFFLSLCTLFAPSMARAEIPVGHFEGLELVATIPDDFSTGTPVLLNGTVDPSLSEVVFSFVPQTGEAVDFFICHLDEGRFEREIIFDHNQSGEYELRVFAGQRGESLPFLGLFAPVRITQGSGPILVPALFFDGIELDQVFPAELGVEEVFEFSGRILDPEVSALRLRLTTAGGILVRESILGFSDFRFSQPLRYLEKEAGDLVFTLVVVLEDQSIWERGNVAVHALSSPGPALVVDVLSVALLSGTSAEIPIRNLGDAPLVILETRVGSPFQLVQSVADIAGGGGAVLTVSYDGEGGDHGTLELLTSDPRRPQTRIALAGLAAAEPGMSFQRLTPDADGRVSVRLDFGARDYAAALYSGQVDGADSGAVHNFALGGGAPVAKSRPAGPLTPGVSDLREFELRRREQLLATAVRLHGLPAAKRSAVEYATGDNRTFLFEEFGPVSTQLISATVVAVSARAVAFVHDDLRVNQRNLSAHQIQQILDRFDLDFDLMLSSFGTPSDVDGDGKIAFLLTHLADDAGVSGFYDADSVVPAAVGGNGNESDLIFITADRPFEFYRSLLVHEFQHLISFNQHALVWSGAAEESWLNEGLSHVAEDLVDGYVDGALHEIVFDFLSDPAAVGLLADANTDSRKRGAAYLFVRSLVDRLGTGVLLRLVQTGLADRDNIERATGERFEDLMAYWSAQLFVSGNGLSDHPRFNYTFPFLRTAGGRAIPMPTALHYDVDGPSVAGSLRPRGVNFVLLEGDGVADIELVGDAAGRVGAVLVPLPKDFTPSVQIPPSYFSGVTFDEPVPAVLRTGEPLSLRGALAEHEMGEIVVQLTPAGSDVTFDLFITVEEGVFDRSIVFDHNFAGDYELALFAGPGGDSLPLIATFRPFRILQGSGRFDLPSTYFNGIRLDAPMPTVFVADQPVALSGELTYRGDDQVLILFSPERGAPRQQVLQTVDGRFDGEILFGLDEVGTYRLEIYSGSSGQELPFRGAFQSVRVTIGPDATAVAEAESVLPASVSLLPNYPNPFNANTAIPYQLPASARGFSLELAVYNLAGQRVATLHRGVVTPGTHLARWSGSSDGGGEAGSGVYIYRLVVGAVTHTGKLLLLR